jgi:hypothetical protein
MLNTAYYCKPVTIGLQFNVIDYIFNQYKHIIENKEDSFPVNLSSDNIASLSLILREDTAKWFSNSETKLIHGILFFLRPFEKQPVHIDNQSKYGIFTSLNIPVLNCEGGIMSWYTGSSYYEEQKNLSDGIKYQQLHIENPSILYNNIINSPHVVRTDIPHNINNTLGKKRVMLALRYNKNIPELEDTNEV